MSDVLKDKQETKVFKRNTIELRGLVINNDTHVCTLNEKELDLTPIEFSIIWYLCVNLDRVVSAEELYEAIWKDSFFDANNTIMVHIRRIREKMNEPNKEPKFIKTVWGVGYKIEK